jgi:thiamine biosynthesis protein ThiS
VELTVNGDKRSVDDGATVADLVRLFDLTPERVAVEVNELLVRRADFSRTALHAGDRVEIVTLVGGG